MWLSKTGYPVKGNNALDVLLFSAVRKTTSAVKTFSALISSQEQIYLNFQTVMEYNFKQGEWLPLANHEVDLYQLSQ